MTKTTKVFVYGSLMSGLSNHVFLEDSTLTARGKTAGNFDMFDLGSFPGVQERTDGHGSPIVGEVYSVAAATLADLDRLEGHPTFYRRKIVEVIEDDGDWSTAWLYELQSPRGQVVESGDWRKHLESAPDWIRTRAGL